MINLNEFLLTFPKTKMLIYEIDDYEYKQIEMGDSTDLFYRYSKKFNDKKVFSARVECDGTIEVVIL